MRTLAFILCVLLASVARGQSTVNLGSTQYDMFRMALGDAGVINTNLSAYVGYNTTHVRHNLYALAEVLGYHDIAYKYYVDHVPSPQSQQSSHFKGYLEDSFTFGSTDPKYFAQQSLWAKLEAIRIDIANLPTITTKVTAIEDKVNSIDTRASSMNSKLADILGTLATLGTINTNLVDVKTAVNTLRTSVEAGLEDVYVIRANVQNWTDAGMETMIGVVAETLPLIQSDVFVARSAIQSWRTAWNTWTSTTGAQLANINTKVTKWDELLLAENVAFIRADAGTIKTQLIQLYDRMELRFFEVITRMDWMIENWPGGEDPSTWTVASPTVNPSAGTAQSRTTEMIAPIKAVAGPLTVPTASEEVPDVIPPTWYFTIPSFTLLGVSFPGRDFTVTFGVYDSFRPLLHGLLLLPVIWASMTRVWEETRRAG